jgi:hypothetical protein
MDGCEHYLTLNQQFIATQDLMLKQDNRTSYFGYTKGYLELIVKFCRQKIPEPGFPNHEQNLVLIGQSA